MERLLAAAQLEQAIADYLAPTEDDWEDLRQRLAALTAFYAGRYLNQAHAPLICIPALPPSETQVEGREPEGLRFYALWPPAWGEAAAAWQRRCAREPVWVLGLRTMGSLLGAMAFAALSPPPFGQHRFSTLRPRGDPNDREIVPAHSLRRALADWRGLFLVVDEGPGLSGSSFGGTVRSLRTLGIAPPRITLLASWRPAGESLTSPYARTEWPQWQVEVAGGLPALPGKDLSAGAWRRVFHLQSPVWPQHERCKYLLDRGRVVAKFAGIAQFGDRVRERAQDLASAGWGPPLTADSGEAWVCFRRLRRRRAVPDLLWAEIAGRYLAWLAANYPLLVGPPSLEMQEMVRVNLAEIGGAPPAEPCEGRLTALDGRMQAVEWAHTARGWIKLDGTDHHDDPFFPGPADIAWDLASIYLEFGRQLGAAARAAYERASGDRGPGLTRRLRWHARAYAAFRHAYCALAAARTQGADAAGFRTLALKYRRQACA